MNTARTAAALPCIRATERLAAALAGAVFSTVLLASVVVGLTGHGHVGSPVTVAAAPAARV